MVAHWSSLVALGSTGAPKSGHRRRCEELWATQVCHSTCVGVACERGSLQPLPSHRDRPGPHPEQAHSHLPPPGSIRPTHKRIWAYSYHTFSLSLFSHYDPYGGHKRTWDSCRSLCLAQARTKACIDAKNVALGALVPALHTLLRQHVQHTFSQRQFSHNDPTEATGGPETIAALKSKMPWWDVEMSRVSFCMGWLAPNCNGN